MDAIIKSKIKKHIDLENKTMDSGAIIQELKALGLTKQNLISNHIFKEDK